MQQQHLPGLFIDQSNDLIWIVDHQLKLTYANKAYLNLMKQVTGVEKQLNQTVMVEGFGEGCIEKWNKYYRRGLAGEQFEFEEQFYHPSTNQVYYSQVCFCPIKEEEGTVMALACQARDVTRLVGRWSEANQLIDASLDVFCTINEHGQFVFVSQAAFHHWGYSPEELVGREYASLIIPEDIAKTNDIADAILAGEEVRSFSNRYRRKDGAIAYNLWSARWDPHAKLMYCVARDAKEKIEQEELLQQSELRFRSLVQEGSDLIAILDAAGRYKYVSPTSTAILGITPNDFLDKSPFDYIHPDDAERTLQSLALIETQEKVQVAPFRFKHQDGEWRWIETVLTNMLNNPSVNGIVANSRDITAKKKEEQLLKLLQSVVTHTNDIVMITEAEPLSDPGPRIIYVNEAFTKITGYTAEEVIGKTPRILQGPQSDLNALTELGEALRKWETREVTTLNCKKNGEQFWINFTCVPVADETGWYTHWFAIERDVTKQIGENLLKNITGSISAVFNTESEIQSALQQVTALVAELGLFSFCEIWLTNIDHTALALAAFAKRDAAGEMYYEDYNPFLQIEKGEGIAGSIWQKGGMFVWDRAASESPVLLRQDAIDKSGINCIVGIPLFRQNVFMGALLVGTKENYQQTKWVIEVLEGLQQLIGGEIARKQIEAQLSKIFSFSPDIITIAGFDGFVKKINPSGIRILEYTEDEFLNMPLLDFVHPDDMQLAKENLVKLADNHPINNLRLRHISKSGVVKTLSWNASPSVKEGLMYAVAKDVSSEMKMEDLLRDASHLSRIGSWEVDLITSTIYWSDVTCQIHETEPDFKPDLASAIKFYREDYREMVASEVAKCIKYGTAFDFEAVIVTAQNNEVWVRSIGRGETINNKCVRIFGSFQDIQVKKQNEIRLKAIANNLPGVIFQYQLFEDGTDKLLHLSQGAQKLWGLAPEEGMKNNSAIWQQVIDGGDMEIVQKTIEISKNNLTDWYCHFRSKHPDGRIRWLEGLGTPNRQVDGSTIWNSIILDITKLKETEELLKSASELARVGSWEMSIADNDEYKMYWSPVTKSILEIDQANEPTLEFGLSLHKEPSKSLVTEAMNNLVATGEPFDLELNLDTAKGKDIWVRCIGNSELSDGKPSRIYGSFQDISDRKIAEIAQQKLLEERNTILESIGDAFFAVDNNWIVTYWNKVAEKVLGKRREDIVGKNLWEEYADAINSDFYRRYWYAVKTGKTVRFEEKYDTLGKWFEVSAYPSPAGLSVYFTDITLRKEADLRLLQANDLFEKVTQATNDAIWDWDLEANTISWGAGFKELFGYEIDNATSTIEFWETSLYPEDVQSVFDSLNTVVKSNENNWTAEYRFKRKDNSYAYVIDRGIVIRNAAGKAIRMVGAMTDISERKKYEEELLVMNKSLDEYARELKRSNEELEQFAFVTSHDLQEPLRMVSSFMDQIKRKYGHQLDEKGLQYIHYATDGAKRMKQLILDLLEYSRSGKLTDTKEDVDLQLIVDEFRLLRRKIIAEKSVKIAAYNLPTILTHKAAVTQIFHLLLDNAIKYTKAGVSPEIEISVEHNQEHWLFCIKDNGIGIEPEFYEKIFIIFQRLHNRNEYEGTGIGLSIAKRHVEALGGRIWVESSLEQGSSFCFTIKK